MRVEDGAEEDLLFRVVDSGEGILPEHLPHIFDYFWRARKSGRAGAGLGLSIAKGIVEEHGRPHLGRERSRRGQHLLVHAAAQLTLSSVLRRGRARSAAPCPSTPPRLPGRITALTPITHARESIHPAAMSEG